MTISRLNHDCRETILTFLPPEDLVSVRKSRCDPFNRALAAISLQKNGPKGIDAYLGIRPVAVHLHTLAEHTGPVTSAVFSSDGMRIATASWDKSCKIWDAQTGRCLHTLTGHTDRLRPAVFSPDGKKIATPSLDWSCKVWDTQTGRCLHTLIGHTGQVRSAVFSPRGGMIATASFDKRCKIWDAQTGKCLHTLIGHTDEIRSAIFSPDGRRVATVSWDNSCKIWDVQTGACLYTLTGHTGKVLSAVFSPNGMMIATASEDKSCKIWGTQTGRCIHTLTGYSNPISSAIFSPNGVKIAITSGEKSCKIYYVSPSQNKHIFDVINCKIPRNTLPKFLQPLNNRDLTIYLVQRIATQTLMGIALAGISPPNNNNLDRLEAYSKPVLKGKKELSKLLPSQEIQIQHPKLYNKLRKMVDIIQKITCVLEQAQGPITAYRFERLPIYQRLEATVHNFLSSSEPITKVKTRIEFPIQE